MATNETKRRKRIGPRYRVVFPLFWCDEAVVELATTDKLIAVYTLSSKQLNRIGLFHFSIGMAAQDLGMELEEVRQGVQRVCDTLSWSFDARSQTMLLPRFFKWNQPTNQCHAGGCLDDLQQLPKTPLLEAWVASALENLLPEYHDVLKCALSKAGHHELAQGVGHPVGTLSAPCQHGVETRTLDSGTRTLEPGTNNLGNECNKPPTPLTETPQPEPPKKVAPAKPSRVVDYRKLVDDYELPEALDTPEARTALIEWLTEKRCRKQTYKQPQSFLSKMADYFKTSEALVAAIDKAIANGWAGCIQGNTPKGGDDDRKGSGGAIRPVNAFGEHVRGGGMVRKISADGEEHFYR